VRGTPAAAGARGPVPGWRRPGWLAAAAVAAAAALCGCQAGPGTTSAGGPGGGAFPARWVPYVRAGTVVDLTAARADGRLTVAAAGRLLLLGPGRAVTPFARGPAGYATEAGAESYLVLSPGGQVPGAGCAFPAGAVFALRPGTGPGVMEVTADGRARRLASLPGTFLNGIALDDVGRFGRRLLVTSVVGGRTSVFSLDCAGRVATIATGLPRVEGGITVAPPSFGAYGGDLIAADELTGRIWAISPAGRAALVVRAAVPSGPDTGPESTGFVPAGFGPGWDAYVADRLTPGNRHPGTGTVLRLPAAGLLRAGTRPGDLLVAAEGGARTIRVRCAAACTAQRVAAGPAVAHTEGHIVFARATG
jgi:hypothetical protein